MLFSALMDPTEKFIFNEKNERVIIKHQFQFEIDFKRLKPDHYYVHSNDHYANALVIRTRFNRAMEKFNYKEDFSTALYIVGIHVNSLCEYRPDCLILGCHSTSQRAMIVSKDWCVLFHVDVAYENNITGG